MHPAPWRTLAILFTGVFMAVLDTFIVFVAAPAIRTDLGASPAELQLLLAGYQLAYAVALVTFARLGDRYGRKPVFLAGLLVFTASSAACAAAPGAGWLVAARFVQGLGAAAMFPQVLAMVHVVVPGPHRPRAFAALGAVIGLSGVTGQLLGGVLVTANLFGSPWRPIFWVNVPLGLLTLALAARFLPRTRSNGTARLDLRGAAVLTVALSLLVVPLVAGREAGWPLWSWCSLAGGGLAMAVFAAVERRVPAPLVRPGLVRQREFSLGMCLVLLTYAGINSFFLVLSLALQDGLGLSPLAAALTYVPFAAAFLAMSLLGGRVRHAPLTGAATAGLGYTVLITLSTTPWSFVPALALIGAGQGLLVPPLLNHVLSAVPRADAGMASGVLATGQQIGGALGVAVIGAVYYSALPGSPLHALALACGGILALTVGAIVILRLLPRR
ncbi:MULTISPECIES: MFS transporter [Amycolatopsis]|uniref:MFS transporter n=1 Tax=Amycolatopsis dendrobii TaxID=2760662 RepID=A0A7W3VU00_9PSEU|nr:MULTISPECIES: MFS transporter [Amycolatopsis]MBB1153034.1 MFS transporter [Amycolatopsis dendrobii]UKD51805.1 MFS transporter [Amycolatopsis sp. FU40]